MIISQYVTFFIVFSFLGWVWETIYCTAKEKHFSNRGFLFGPICPIYGASVVVGMFLFTQIGWLQAASMPVWELFLICAVGSAFAEYGTSYYLEKRFHARWWDYSKMPLNINGRICLPVTVCFGLVGIALVRWMIPVLSGVQSQVHPLVFEAVALAFIGMLGADLALTEASLSTLLQKIEESDKEFTARGEAAYENITNKPQQLETKLSGLEDELRERADALAAELNGRQRHIARCIRKFPEDRSGRRVVRVGTHLRESLQEMKNK